MKYNAEAEWDSMIEQSKTLHRIGFKILREEECETIHNAVLEVLTTVGVYVFHSEARKLLRKAGAAVSGEKVFISEKLLQNALDSAPGEFILYGREGDPAIHLAEGRSYFGSGSETQFTYDIETGKRRESVLADISNAARVADALPNVDFVMALGMASDVPQEQYSEYQFRAMLENTVKPLLYIAAARENLEKILDMAEAVAGSREELIRRPFLLLFAQPSTPLQHSQVALDKLLVCAERRAPVLYVSAAMLGGTAPVTMAGSLVLVLAETLSGLVIHQLKAPGAPFVSGGAAPQMDMRTFLCSYGAPELQLSCGAIVEMARFYSLPVFTTAGCSDAQVFDQQAGMEAGYTILTQALAGGNLIHDLGYIGAGMTSSLEMLSLCSEMAGIARHIVRGIPVNSDTIAMDVIRNVEPGGNFLTEAHTVDHYKENLHFTELLNRLDYTQWLRQGAEDFYARANEQVRRILGSHTVPGLTGETGEKLNTIMNR
jgi:trimethylamine--corrinoid protein Co-methyltransferase